MSESFKKTLRKVRKLLLIFSLVFVGLSVLWVSVYKWVDPPSTILMSSRADADTQIRRQWVDLEHISPRLQLAILCAEDIYFPYHKGFDLAAIKRAIEINKQGERLVGASTISQQCAKNVFLWESRNWLRKGLEAWFTVLIELIWGKERIMEVYLNVIEMGDGVFGAEAASRHYFDVSASDLSDYQAAKIASIVPCPVNCGMESEFSNGRTKALQHAMEHGGVSLAYLK